MQDEQCDLVAVDGGVNTRCPDRAEYAVRTVGDQLFVCDLHRGWAQDRLGGEPMRTDLLHPEEWPSGFAGKWTTTQAAAHCGVAPSTLRDYASSGRAPAPLPERDPTTGAKLYDAQAVKDWHASRPGKGWRAGETSIV